MMNLMWNATLNRLGAGAIAFYIGSKLPGGANYLQFLGVSNGMAAPSALLEGLFFIVCSYFLGSLLVGVGRRRQFRLSEMSWEDQIVVAAKSENEFLQASLLSYIDRSDAYAGVGQALILFAIMVPIYAILGHLIVAIWLFAGAIVGYGLLRQARFEFSSSKRLIEHFRGTES